MKTVMMAGQATKHWPETHSNDLLSYLVSLSLHECFFTKLHVVFHGLQAQNSHKTWTKEDTKLLEQYQS